MTYAGISINGSALNQLNTPTGLFIDSDDTLYITDSANCRIMAYSYNANIGTMVAGTGSCGSGLNQFASGARYLFVDSNKNIYVSDQSNQRVMRWASGGSTGVMVAGTGAGGSSLSQVNYPYGIWVDSNSNIFLAEYNNNRVTKWASGSSAGIIVAGNGTAGMYVCTLSENLVYTVCK